MKLSYDIVGGITTQEGWKQKQFTTIMNLVQFLPGFNSLTFMCIDKVPNAIIHSSAGSN